MLNDAIKGMLGYFEVMISEIYMHPEQFLFSKLTFLWI